MKKGGAHVSLIVGVTIRAPAAAVKAGRDRGPSVTHRRAKEQAAEAAAAEQKPSKKPSTKKALGGRRRLTAFERVPFDYHLLCNFVISVSLM